MNLQMLWLDTRTLPLSKKIQDALAHYEKKYGPPPYVVTVPLNEESDEGLDIEVHKDKYILPFHMLIGSKDE